jgi:two-component system, OmpR family, phosphate regulon sensor histidine kinase PhoR
VSVASIFLAAIAAVLAIRVAYHQRHLSALRDWLRRPRLDALPRGRGVWEEALAELHRFLRGRGAEHETVVQSLVRFRAAVRALPDGVVILDRDKRIEWANPIAAHHLGIDARRDLGQPVVNLVRHPHFVTYLDAGDFREPLALRARDTTLSLRIISTPCAATSSPTFPTSSRLR